MATAKRAQGSQSLGAFACVAVLVTPPTRGGVTTPIISRPVKARKN